MGKVCLRKKKTSKPVSHCKKYGKNGKCVSKKRGSVEKRCAKYSRKPGRPKGSKNKKSRSRSKSPRK